MRSSNRLVLAGAALFLVIGLGGLAVGIFGLGSGDRYALALSTEDAFDCSDTHTLYFTQDGNFLICAGHEVLSPDGFTEADVKQAGGLIHEVTSDNQVDAADRRRLANLAKEINQRHGEKPFSTTGFVVMGAGLLVAGSLGLWSLISKSLLRAG